MRHSFSIIITLFLFCLPAFRAIGQTEAPSPSLPVDAETKKIMYRAVVDEPGTPAYLYDQAINWFGYYYRNPQSIYSVQDKVNGKIEGQGRFRIYVQDEKNNIRQDAGTIVYQIRIELKENKYRYTFTDFNLKDVSRNPIEKWMNKTDPAYNPLWESYIYQVDTVMQRLVTSLKEKMKPVVIKKDEW